MILLLQRALLLIAASLGSAPQRESGREPWIPEIPRGADPLGDIACEDAPDGIVPLPDSVDPRLAEHFDRYTRVLAPDGRPIHILAQGGWRNDQIVRARKVLEHLLTDVPGSRYGADKAPVANAMAERRATLVLFDTADDMERAFRGSLGEVPLGCQDLRANECPVEGDPDYLRHETRDAAFEEILHLVHDYGIRPTLSEYDEELHAANVAAAERGLWTAWPEDEPENHRNEYFAAIYDNYLDLWTVEPTRYEGEPLSDDMIPDGTSHFGMYGAGSRASLREADPVGYALIEDFLPRHLTYAPALPPEFDGTFYLRRESELRYTVASQHLVDVSLTGSRDAGLVGNAAANRLVGNAGDNVLEGGAGDDHLAGGAGRDVAVFSGPVADYEIGRSGDGFVVGDRRPDRDGIDRLVDVEVARFADGVRELVRSPVAIGFALLEEPELAVAIEVACTGAPDGATTFAVSEAWGGVSAGGEDLVMTSVAGRDGRTLAFERLAPHRILVRHDPDESLRFTYRIPANKHQAAPEVAEFRRPIVNARLFRSFGTLCLFLPEHLDGQLAGSVSFSWTGFAAANWTPICSFGVPAEPDGHLVVEERLDDVRHALYVAGDVRLERRDVRGSPVYVSLEGDRWGFADEEFFDLAVRTVEVERAFFDDFDRAFYWINLIPVGPELGPGSQSLGGSALANCFALSMHPNATLAGERAGYAVRELLAHEMFHEWNGQVIRRAPPEELAYWFSEGFTNFYARRLLYRSGGCTAAEYAASLNRAIEQYLTSPVRTETVERVLADFWNDRHVKDLPYRRGELIATLVDHEIRKASDGARSLDDLMRELVIEAREDDRRVDNERLLAKFAAHANQETADLVRSVLYQGVLLELPDDLYAGCLGRLDELTRAFDLGFDFEFSFAASTVIGLREDSAAYAAGLREGQTVTGWSIYHGDVSREVVLTVREAGAQREIRYFPHGAEYVIPRFTAPSETGDRGDCSAL